LSDGESGQTWSAGYQPAGVEPDRYDAIYSEDRVEIDRRDGAIATSLRTVVSTEDDAEMRQISLTNFGVRTREIDITSYAEIVLAPAAADAAHPAFSNLFVQTQFVPAIEALLASRRPRDREERVWAAHVMTVHGELVGMLQYDTDRARFLGRGRTIRHPSAIEERRPLSNTVGTVLDQIFSIRRRLAASAGRRPLWRPGGAVLDPIFSIRRRLRLPPGATARVQLALMVAETR